MKKLCIFTHNDRFYIVVFYESPKPSEYNDEVCRHLSLCHSTDGFSSYSDAFKSAMNLQNSNPDKFEFSPYTETLDNLNTGQMERYLERSTCYDADLGVL